MPATDRPMLTKREVAELNLITREWLGRDNKSCNTIERAVELLERCVNGINSLHRETDCEGECAATRLAKDATDFLAAYHGTEKEGGGR